MHTLSVIFLVQLAGWLKVAAQATDAGPCFAPGEPCYVFAIELKACNYDYSCLCGSGSQACFCGAAHVFGPACIACRTTNGTYDVFAAEINDSLTSCIGINGTNAAVVPAAPSTTSGSLTTSSVTSLTTIVTVFTSTNAAGAPTTVSSTVTTASIVAVTSTPTNHAKSSSSTSGLSTKTKAIIGAAVGVAILLGLGIFLGWLCCGRKRRAASNPVVQSVYSNGNSYQPPYQPYAYEPVPYTGANGYAPPPAPTRGINSDMEQQELSGGRLQKHVSS